MFSLILGLDIFLGDRLDYANKVEFGISNMGLLLLGGAVLFLLFSLINREKQKLQMVELCILGAVLFIIQQYIIRHAYFLTGWDAGTVNNIADVIAFGGRWDDFWTFYIQKYPNNVLLVCIFAAMKHIAAFLHYDPDAFLVWMNIIVIDFSVVLSGVVLCRIVNGKAWARCGLFLMVLLVGFSPWMMIPYSDTFSLPFPIITIFLYLRYKETSIGSIVEICLIPLIGMLIKPQCIILLIAIVLTELMENSHKIRVAALAKKTAIFVFCIGMTVVVSVVAHDICGVQKDKDAQVSYTHYLMMGLNKNSDGSFSFEDNDITDSVYGYKEKQSKNWSVIRERIKDMGILGLCRHEGRKLLVNYNDGTFAYGKEGGFYNDVIDQEADHSQWLRLVYRDDGKYFHILAGILQSVWLTVLAVCLLGLVMNKDAISGYRMVLLLSLLGNMAFSILFEARARYQLMFVPVYILFAISMMDEVHITAFAEKSKRRRNI